MCGQHIRFGGGCPHPGSAGCRVTLQQEVHTLPQEIRLGAARARAEPGQLVEIVS
jgi:hypothetical protein